MANSKAHSNTRPETVTRAFVLPREQDEALKRLAAQNHRSFSGELRFLVSKHLDAITEEEAA